MLVQNLVSLISPFYNAESFLERFLDSVLAQTYTNLQFILVNDGSTDNSNTIVDRFRPELEKKFAEFVYLKQENGGAAAAINLALKYVKGEYLCWADCDDELWPDNIRQKYFYLQHHKEYGMVCCAAKAVDQTTGKVLETLKIPEENRSDNMFLQIIKGIPVYPGVFMLRTKLLFDKLDNREIYFNREAGQNFQLLLPVAYYNKCGFIDSILYNYYIRPDSHSHNTDYRREFERTYVREIVLGQVLKVIPEQEQKKIMRNVRYNCIMRRFYLSFDSNDRVRNNEVYAELKPYPIPFKILIKHAIINVAFLNYIYRLRGKC